MHNTDINFADYMYSKLPEIHRILDNTPIAKKVLYRYLSALDEGALRRVFNSILILYDITNEDKCPKEVLPLLAKMLGYNYIDEVEERVQRKIIANLIELYKRKGTKSVINFIAREFTKGDVEVIEMEHRIFRTWSPTSNEIPSSQYVISKTLEDRVTKDTCCLFGEEGKYNNKSIQVIVNSDEANLMLLNRLLVEFLPVLCKVHIRTNTVDKYSEDIALVHTEETNNKYTTRYSEDININTLSSHTSSVRLKTEGEDIYMSAKNKPKNKDHVLTHNETNVLTTIDKDLKDKVKTKTTDTVTIKLLSKDKLKNIKESHKEVVKINLDDITK